MLRRLARFLLVSAPMVLLLASYGYGAEGEASAGGSFLPLGSGLAIGLAALGGGIGQGIAIWGGLSGIARNPGAGGRISTYLIVGLAFVESLVIYAFVIAFILQGKI